MSGVDPAERSRSIARRTAKSLPHGSRRRRTRSVIAGVTATILVVGLLATLRPWETTADSTPEGFVRVDVGTIASIAIPPDWQVIDGDDFVRVRAESPDGTADVEVREYDGPLNPSLSDLRAELDRDLSDAGYESADGVRFEHPIEDLDVACRGPIDRGDGTVMAVCLWPFNDFRPLLVTAVGPPGSYVDLALVAASIEYI